MARVPDMFEALQSCYSENKEFNSDIDQVLWSQDSFYSSTSPHYKEHVDKLTTSLSSPEISKTQEFTFPECVAVTGAKKKIVKKRRLSVNHPITHDYLFNTGNNTGKNADIIKRASASFNFHNRVNYRFNSYTKRQTLADEMNRRLQRSGSSLQAIHLRHGMKEDFFDICKYMTLDIPEIPGIIVALKISDTNLFVSAKKEGEPVELVDLSETPRHLDESHNHLLFYWVDYSPGHYYTFHSLTNSKLCLATSTEHQQVFMAREPPALINFLVMDEE